MPGKILRVVHRHGEQRKEEGDLVLEVGKAIPRHYQAGRPRGIRVLSIVEKEKVLECSLGYGDVIYIEKGKISEVTRSDEAV